MLNGVMGVFSVGVMVCSGFFACSLSGLGPFRSVNSGLLHRKKYAPIAIEQQYAA